ncbi:MAG: DUF3656 domain-containing protein [Brotaphodocola sp.]
MRLRERVEILAPAGSVESMMAAVNAGADAIYMGGSRFGARAYADNPEEDRFLEAIDYVHLHGCKLYMTVNTLVKESELDELYDYLKPYYERGLDAVIVQDMGVFSYIRKYFPDMPIHASTQMTVTGFRSAGMLKEMGASRIVTARELSLDEIRSIRDHVDIEIESFVHGALCYCYSGQCLLSSLIGGRSGNRGRCAQPCRLPYDVLGQQGRTRQGAKKEQRKAADERYLLSLKDLCTLDILPDIIEAGVYSLKIEGRMKSPRYTAGVVSIYRKYVDRYLQYGRNGYRVDPADKKILLDLFDRGGFTEGYYRQHNGRDMVALKEKPAFREGNQALFDRLDREYVNAKKQEPMIGHVVMHEGEPIVLQIFKGEHEVVVIGDQVESAQNQPLSEEKLLKQINKTGNTPFYFEQLTAEITGMCFMPLQALNELRRNGLEQLEQAILKPFQRTAPEIRCLHQEQKLPCLSHQMKIHVSIEEPESLQAVAAHPDVDAVYLDSVGFEAQQWERAAELCHNAGKQCALILPQIFRTEAERYFRKNQELLCRAGFDEMVLRSMEEVSFLKEIGLADVPMVFDANLYSMNRMAEDWMKKAGAVRQTLPLELNSRELAELDCTNRELIAYGYLPAMVSAQCIVCTTEGCKKQPKLLKMKDRTGKILPVKNHCRFCYNTIYNPSPLSLLGQEQTVKHLNPAVLRLQFVMESPEQTKAVIDAYADHFRYGKETPAPFDDFTRGHMKRGVE